MIINISVPYTEMELTSDSFEEQLGYKNSQPIEDIIADMFEQGYNMDVFYSDYDLDTNLRRYEICCDQCLHHFCESRNLECQCGCQNEMEISS